ncbi:MAG: hypothetical protein M1816_000118 [Peltula sp. TS41687]|nr:MAG: hypothetical protein M1816_000118 [Peltula sp. TS41687]
MHLIRISTLFTLFITTFALPSNPVVDGGDVSRIINKAKEQGVPYQIVLKDQREALFQNPALKQAARTPTANRSAQKKLVSRNAAPQNPVVNAINELEKNINSGLDVVTHARPLSSPYVSDALGIPLLGELVTAGVGIFGVVAGLDVVVTASVMILLGLGVAGIAILLQGYDLPGGAEIRRIFSMAKRRGVSVHIVRKSQQEAFLRDLARKQAAKPQRVRTG